MALRFGLISSCNEVEIRYVRSPGYVDWLLYLSAEVHMDQCPTFPSLSQAWLLGTIATYTGNTCDANYNMAVFHDEVEIEDFEYDEESETYFYPCPCGDQFEITKVCNAALIESHM